MNFSNFLNISGFILGVIGIFLSYYFYIKSLRVKSPYYDIKDINLINGFSNQLSDLNIRFKGKEVENLTVTKIAFWNDGNETINRIDVVEDFPVVIIASEGVEILDCKILETNEPTNNFSILNLGNEMYSVVDFDYIDGQDGVIIQVVHTGKGEAKDIILSGKIKGVDKIKYMSTRKRSWGTMSFLSFGVLYLITMSGFSAYELFVLKNGDLMRSVSNIMFLIFTPLAFYLYIRYIFFDNKNLAKLPKGLSRINDE